MEAQGVEFIHADKSPGSRIRGWGIMREGLTNSYLASRGEKDCPPGTYIFKSCKQFIRTIPPLPRDEKDMDDVDTDSEDHIADEARYMHLFNGKSKEMTVRKF
jgi:hypothetical protein